MRAENASGSRCYGQTADTDLRVDLHETAVEELRHYTEYQLYEDYYRDCGRDPRGAMPQEKFMAQLNAAEA